MKCKKWKEKETETTELIFFTRSILLTSSSHGYSWTMTEQGPEISVLQSTQVHA